MFWKNLLKVKSSPLPLSEIDYDLYFNTDKYGDFKLSILELGKLNLPTGKVVVCDPLCPTGKISPFIKEINPGQYPVKILVARTQEMGDRNALSKLEISLEKAVKWELAITADAQQKVKSLKEGEYLGFPVDTGLGCFCDYLTQQQYTTFEESFYEEHPVGNIYDEYFAEKFKVNAVDHDDPNDLGNWLNYSIPDTENNIIMFQSGFGDGYYPVYWGYSQDGTIVSLLIDFKVLE